MHLRPPLIERSSATRRAWVALAALGFALPAAAWGAAASGTLPVTTESLSVAPLPDAGLSVLRVIGAFGLVLALFFGGVWLSRNWRRLAHRPAARADLQIYEMRPLGVRQALWVVGYRRQRLLIASAPSGVTLLSPLPDAEGEVPEPGSGTDFSAAFQNLLRRS